MESNQKVDKAFLRFLTTGVLGDIGVNTPIDKVYKVLGTPDNVATEHWKINNVTMTNLFYGNSLIFTFLDLILHLIILECRFKEVRLPSGLDIPWLPLVQRMTYTTFRDYLKKQYIQCYQVDITPFESEGILLWLPKGKIEVTFNAARNYRIDQITCGIGKASGWKLKEC